MKKCIVCECNDQKATFHKFPSNPSMRQKWLNQCNIKGIIPNYSYICASHFKKEDYFSTRLKKNALPKLVEDQIEVQYFPSHCKKEVLSCSESSKPYVENSPKISTSTHLFSVTDHGENTILFRNSIMTSNGSLINKQRCARRLIQKPSNVASLTNENFSTSRRAKLNFNLIKNQLILKDKKIKCLTECNQRLLIKVKNLKEMIKVLEKQNMLSEQQASQILKDHLKAYFSEARGRSRFNNNSSCFQFEHAYKCLLVNNPITASYFGNCGILDATTISQLELNATNNIIQGSRRKELTDHDYLY